jgi:predicted DCC family thiol-disulfide oxidoreductase YuxK
MNSSTYPLTIYYDASCPVCDGEMHNLMLRNTDGMLVFVDASAPDFVSPLAGLAQADLLNLIHARKANGEVVRSVEVLRLAYRAVGLGWVAAAASWPGLRQLADRAYPWLAHNRYRIPRPLVRLLFEGPTRRAAERVAEQAAERAAQRLAERGCHGRSCRL